MPRTQTYEIRKPRQIRALASPARQEIVDGLQAIGPCSVVELAEELGRAPDSLYYHLRLLAAVGLVVQRGSRKAGRRDEMIYDTPSARMKIDIQPTTRAEREGILKIVAAALRIAQRDVRVAITGGIAKYRGFKRNTLAGRIKGWLTDDELREVNEHIEAVIELLARGDRGGRSKLYVVSWTMAPVVPSSRAGAASRGESKT